MPQYQDVSLDISSIVGDTVHNFRSALNLLAFQLALRNTNGQIKNERRIQFPIEDDPIVYERRCRATSDKDVGGWIAELSASDQDIIREFQPYRSNQEGQYLRLIRDVNDADKHRVLIRVGIAANYIHNADERIQTIAAAFMQTHGLDAMLQSVIAPELGTELYGAVIPDWPETNVHVAGYVLPMLILVDTARPLPYAVGKALAFMAEAVGNILYKFSPLPSEWGVTLGPQNPPPPFPFPTSRPDIEGLQE
jgi:hypothetical protein